MSKKSGITNVRIWAEKLHMELTDEEVEEVLREVKTVSHDKKKALDEQEFREIVRRIQARK
jgi:isopropylmalate/homocitrate/citramalate synthase